MPNVTNKDTALVYLEELLAQLCKCGCLESEHFLNKELVASNCAECDCKEFTQAYTMKSLLEEMFSAR